MSKSTKVKYSGNMDFMLFIKGLLLGLSIAAPVGPIGVLCIRRTLTYGRLDGLVTGLGAASADAFYGAVAGLGITAVSAWLLSYQRWLVVAGGIFLCYLGLQSLLTRPPAVAVTDRQQNGSLWITFGATFFLTITNPATILMFLALFASLGLAGSAASLGAAGLLVAGVFTGSALWWLTLSSGVGWLRTKLGTGALRWVNRAAGLSITAFGLLVLLNGP